MESRRGADGGGPRWPALLPYIVLFAGHMVSTLVFVLDRSPGTNAAITGLPLDDGWIHLVYARSLAAFEGFSYNAGQPEAGFTSPLWALVVAPLFWVHWLVDVDIVVLVKLLGTAIALGSSAIAFRLVRTITGDAVAAYAAGLAIAIDPSLSFAKLSGMEVVLASLMVLACLDAIARRRPLVAGVLLALAPLARPENALFAAIALAVVVRGSIRDRAPARRLVAAVAPVLVAAAWWTGFCLLVSGRPLPNTYYAKVPGTSELFGQNLATEVGPMLIDLPWFSTGTLVADNPWLAVAIGCVPLFVGATVLARTQRQRVVAIVVVAHPLIFMVGVARAHTLQQWWPFYWNRYFEPAIPFLIIVAAAGMVAWIRHALRGVRHSWLQRASLVVAGAYVLAIVGRLPGRTTMKSELLAWNCQNINELNVAVGKWLRDHSEPGEWIAANDAGAVRYFSDRSVVDLLGLNNAAIIRGGLDAELADKKPRLYAVFASWFPQIMHSSKFHQVHAVRAPVYTICDCPQDEVLVFERTP